MKLNKKVAEKQLKDQLQGVFKTIKVLNIETFDEDLQDVGALKTREKENAIIEKLKKEFYELKEKDPTKFYESYIESDYETENEPPIEEVIKNFTFEEADIDSEVWYEFEDEYKWINCKFCTIEVLLDCYITSLTFLYTKKGELKTCRDDSSTGKLLEDEDYLSDFIEMYVPITTRHLCKEIINSLIINHFSILQVASRAWNDISPSRNLPKIKDWLCWKNISFYDIKTREEIPTVRPEAVINEFANYIEKNK